MLCPDTTAVGILVDCLVAAKHQDHFLFRHLTAGLYVRWQYCGKQADSVYPLNYGFSGRVFSRRVRDYGTIGKAENWKAETGKGGKLKPES
jgi:hypothetical protein